MSDLSERVEAAVESAFAKHAHPPGLLFDTLVALGPVIDALDAPGRACPWTVQEIERMASDADAAAGDDWQSGGAQQFRETAKMLRFLLASLSSNWTWMSMETAPKDGTDVFLFTGKRRFIGHYGPSSIGAGWFSNGDPIIPTHWMPLPAPPPHGERT